MRLFSIFIEENSCKINRLFENMVNELEILHNHHDGIALRLQDQQNRMEIVCEVLGEMPVQAEIQSIHERSASALAQYVIQEMEPQLIDRFILQKYDHLSERERKQISKYCFSTSEKSEILKAENQRKEKLKLEFSRFLEKSSILNLEGFIHFRMQAYKGELQSAIEFAMDEYVIEQQYQDFISLLKYFVFIQDTKIPLVHVFHKRQHEYQLLNEQLKPIKIEKTDELVVELLDQESTFEDLIVTQLVTASPQSIIIHTRNPKMQSIQTIEKIFEDKVQLCTSCKYCEQVLDNHETDQMTTT